MLFLAGIILTVFLYGYWLSALGLILLLVLLALSIQYPQLKDRWQRRREERLESR